MHLTQLSLSGFRLFNRLDMQVPRRIILLAGNNAQGKTSILEAIYYLSTFTSFQASHDRQMISFNQNNQSLAVARITADFFHHNAQHRLEVRIIQEPNGLGGVRSRKEILYDNVKRNAQDSVGLFSSVLFLPQMMRILDGGPDERRRYLNLMTAQALPGFTRLLSEYNQAVSQRNALLKLLNERGGDPDQLDYWDDILTSRGAQIMYSRIKVIQEIEKLASQYHRQLTQDEEVLRLLYQPSYEPAPLLHSKHSQQVLPLMVDVDRSSLTMDEVQKGYREKLRTMRREEMIRGVTLLGPHRDEMRVLSNQIDLGLYGSRGQLRTALMALKMAEVYWLQQKNGSWPVFLLDETLAELDQTRRDNLLSIISQCEQALLTTADPGQFNREFIDSQTVWYIQNGSLIKEQT